MFRELSGAAVLALGMWAILIVGIMSPRATPASPDLWVVTGSDRMNSRPTLARAAPPRPPMEAGDEERGGRGLVPEG